MNGDIQAAGELLAKLRGAYLSLPSQSQADVTQVLSSLVRAQAHVVETGAQETVERARRDSCQSDSARTGLPRSTSRQHLRLGLHDFILELAEARL